MSATPRPATTSQDAMPEPIDLLICPEWIIPIEPARMVLSNHALAVKAGRIVELLPTDDALAKYTARETFRLPGEVLLPGLVNLHTHSAMTLMRGFADDLPLMTWLQEHIWPAEARHVSSEFVRHGSLLAVAEMLRGGVTTMNDMYFFPEATAEACLRLGQRAALGMIVIEFPSAWAADPDDYLNKGLAIRDAHIDEPLLSFCLAPHAPYTVSDRSFEKVATLAAQLDVPVHIHVHETRHEIEESLRQHGMRPIRRLHQLGLLGPQLIAVHAVHLDAAEIDLLAHEGCNMAHCPTSNLKLASGIPPMAAVQQRGLNFGLGTDGAASNNRIDLFQEMRHAALLAKGASENATVLDAHSILRAATLGGAMALGLGDQIGSLEPGKFADLCTVKLDDWTTRPCFDPASHLVYVVGREQVTHTWVAGETRLKAGCLTGIDRSELQDIAGLWHTRLTG